MKTSERLEKVATFFSEHRAYRYSAADLSTLIESELGHREILDQPIQQAHGVAFQAFAPESIYHVCASTLPVSAEMSLLLGLVLGSSLTFKLPKTGLPQLEELASQAAALFDQPVTILKSHDPERMKQAGAVVVFGNDDTVQQLKMQTLQHQRFLGYGHKISVGLLGLKTSSIKIAQRAAAEMCAYEQAGCLSPQAYLCPDFEEALQFAQLLAKALKEQEKTNPAPARNFEENALIFEARQRALLRGNRVWGMDEKQPWTIIFRQDGFLEVGPGHRTIQIIPGTDWERILKPWKGKISSFSYSDDAELLDLIPRLNNLGISRVCPIGQLQEPALTWRHDGRPRLADLVSWMTWERLPAL